MQWNTPIRWKWARRVTPVAYLQNVLHGVAQALHGDNVRGRGYPATPDRVLLVPRSFDVSTNRLRSHGNSRLHDTRPGRTLLRDPFRLVVDFSLNRSVDFDIQQLRRSVEPLNGPAGWARRSADSLASFYLSNTSSIHKVLLAESDSLFLSANQVLGLRRADSVYSARVRAVYVPLGQFLAQGNGTAGKAELDSVQATQKLYWKIFWEQPEIADSLVTPAQRELIPIFKNMLATPKEAREHSQWQFGR